MPRRQPKAGPSAAGRPLPDLAVPHLSVVHVWAHPVRLAARTHDGRPLRLLIVVDEYTRQCLAIKAARRIRADDVLHSLMELFVAHGSPRTRAPATHPRVHQPGRAGLAWPRRYPSAPSPGPAAPQANGHIRESFNGKLRDEPHRP